MRPVFEWNIGRRSLSLGKRTLVMGVVNVTPDSFSDGGLYLDTGRALDHALKTLEEGADLVDIGGESTQPGTTAGYLKGNAIPRIGQTDSTVPLKPAVSEMEEIERVIPVIKALKQVRPDCIISVDTYKSVVARRAMEAGAEIVNDVSGFRWDPKMAETLAELECGAILVHTRGHPDEWHSLPPPSDIVVQAKRELRDWADRALMSGVKRERIVLDPGFGFGKRLEQNYPLLKRFDEFHQLRYPLLVGVSRKSFIGRAIARHGKDAAVDQRAYGTLAAETIAIVKGAHIIRTHDVRAAMDSAMVADVVA